MDTVTYYAFRLGEALVYAGPYGPAYVEHPPPSPMDTSRRSSAPPSMIGSDSPGGRGLLSESPVSRARAAASGAAKALLSRGHRMGWNSNKQEKETEESRWNGGEWGSGGGRSSGSTTSASGSSAGHLGARRGDSGVEGSRIERAVSEALDR